MSYHHLVVTTIRGNTRRDNHLIRGQWYPAIVDLWSILRSRHNSIPLNTHDRLRLGFGCLRVGGQRAGVALYKYPQYPHLYLNWIDSKMYEEPKERLERVTFATSAIIEIMT